MWSATFSRTSPRHSATELTAWTAGLTYTRVVSRVTDGRQAESMSGPSHDYQTENKDVPMRSQSESN